LTVSQPLREFQCNWKTTKHRGSAWSCFAVVFGIPSRCWGCSNAPTRNRKDEGDAQHTAKEQGRTRKAKTNGTGPKQCTKGSSNCQLGTGRRFRFQWLETQIRLLQCYYCARLFPRFVSCAFGGKSFVRAPRFSLYSPVISAHTRRRFGYFAYFPHVSAKLSIGGVLLNSLSAFLPALDLPLRSVLTRPVWPRHRRSILPSFSGHERPEHFPTTSDWSYWLSPSYVGTYVALTLADSTWRYF